MDLSLLDKQLDDFLSGKQLQQKFPDTFKMPENKYTKIDVFGNFSFSEQRYY
jgi:hypothetical protein